MLVLISYDVSTVTAKGRKRLHKVAKYCEKYGQRVQNSVFECNLEFSQYILVQHELSKIISVEEDSLRFYNLGNNYENKVVHIGKKTSIPLEDNIII